jgi:serine/threonine protein kinase
MKTDRKRIEEEVKLGKRLKTPFLVEVINTFEEEGIIYIVMELCEGGTLREYMNDYKKYGPISEKVLFSFFLFLSPSLLILSLLCLPLSFSLSLC